MPSERLTQNLICAYRTPVCWMAVPRHRMLSCPGKAVLASNILRWAILEAVNHNVPIDWQVEVCWDRNSLAKCAPEAGVQATSWFTRNELLSNNRPLRHCDILGVDLCEHPWERSKERVDAPNPRVTYEREASKTRESELRLDMNYLTR